MADYPDNLPEITISSYNVNVGRMVIQEQQANSGSLNYRQRFRGGIPSAVNVRWIFTNEQYVAFRSWWNGNNQGAAWAKVPIPMGSGANSLIRFVKPFIVKPLSGTEIWEVVAELQIREISLMSEDDYRDYIEGAVSLEFLNDVEYIEDKLHKYVHNDRPIIYPWEDGWFADGFTNDVEFISAELHNYVHVKRPQTYSWE